MKQDAVTVDGLQTVIIENINGDLQVAGWERPEVSVKTDDDDATLRVDGDRVLVSAAGDLILYIPREASLQTASISGDADIRAVSGNIRMENIGGDLQMRAIGAAVIGRVGGDLNVRGCTGDFTAQVVGSDASLRDVQGKLNLVTVGADLYLRNLSADIQAQTGADAILYLQPGPKAIVNVRAGADILLRMPADVDAELSLQGGSPESIRIDFLDMDPGGFGPVRTVKIGAGSAKIRLMAGADLIVTSQSDGVPSNVQVDPDGPGEMPPPPGGFGSGFPGVPPDFSNFHEHFMKNVTEAKEKAERHRERAERQVEAAMRRAEEKMRAAERRTNFAGVAVGRGGSVGRPPSPMVPPPPPPPVNEPVSDVERLTVLKMLQDKKISLQEAEKLLSALEGK